MSRSFATVFEENEFDVVRAATGDDALAIARRLRPDAVLLDDSPGDIDAVAICRALYADPNFHPSAPTAITAAPHLASTMRLEAYRAGAWEYCSQPLDVELLMLKLKTFLRAHQSLLDARAERTIDATTGLYTTVGLQHVAEKLLAHASRTREPIACVAIAADGRGDGQVASSDDGDGVLQRTLELCRAQSRGSDVIGRMRGSRLALLAPDTDADGARAMVERLQRSLDQNRRMVPQVASSRLVAGYCVLGHAAKDRIGGAEFLRRAEVALDRAENDRAR